MDDIPSGLSHSSDARSLWRITITLLKLNTIVPRMGSRMVIVTISYFIGDTMRKSGANHAL